MLRNMDKQARREARRAQWRAVRNGKTPFVPEHVAKLAQKRILTFGELRNLQDKKERNSSRKVENNLQDEKERNSSRKVKNNLQDTKQRNSLRKGDNNAENRKAFKAMHDQKTAAMKVEAHPATAASQQPRYHAEVREAVKAMFDEITAGRFKAKAQRRLD